VIPAPAAAAIILAAGASTRMGRPKALLTLHGETFLDRLIRVFASAGAAPTVVLGHGATYIAQQSPRCPEALLVLNPHPERGQLSSLQCGLAAASFDLVFFTPVDSPGVQPETIARLIAAWIEAGRPPVVTPRFEGRHGHPVGIRRDVAAELLAAPPASSARDILRRHSDATLRLDVDDPAVLWDLDDEAALRAALEGNPSA